MKILLEPNRIPVGAMISIVGMGYALGIGVIFGGFFVLALLVSLFSGEQQVGSVVMGLIMFPLILLLQGLMLGLLTSLGLKIYSIFKPIEIEMKNENQA